jgi:hypothetical protein
MKQGRAVVVVALVVVAWLMRERIRTAFETLRLRMQG